MGKDFVVRRPTLIASELLVKRGQDFELTVRRLELDRGSRVGLIGPNGAGKTTLLTALAGHLRPTKGKISVLDIPLEEWGYKVGLVVGLVKDRLEGLQWMTVREHLDLRSHAFDGWDDDYAADLVAELQIPLEKRLDELSKGNRAKVAFVSVESYRPPILLLDEPTSGLDPVVRGTFQAILCRTVSETVPRSLLFSTHLTEDIEAICDRILVIVDGQLIGDRTVPTGASPTVRRSIVKAGVRLIQDQTHRSESETAE